LSPSIPTYGELVLPDEEPLAVETAEALRFTPV
jgi:hypothetical protein